MINLVYCGNEGVFKGICMSLLSAQETTKEALSVTILTGDFTNIDARFRPFNEKERALLENALKAKNPESVIRVVDVTEPFNRELEKSPNCKSSYTPYTLLRLFLDEVPSVPDKLLYLDADTIVMKDLLRLFSMDLGDNYCGWVLDRFGHIFINPRYCNAGVILLNIPLLKRDGIFLSCRALLNKKKYSFPDQDVLNALTKGRKLILPHEFNEQKRLHSVTVIRHYCNQPRIFPYVHAMVAKPWDLERIHKVYKTTVHDALHEECRLLWRSLEK
jgi:lipopolysaccharide biosynthesis glycosyltransferase